MDMMQAAEPDRIHIIGQVGGGGAAERDQAIAKELADGVVNPLGQAGADQAIGDAG